MFLSCSDPNLFTNKVGCLLVLVKNEMSTFKLNIFTQKYQGHNIKHFFARIKSKSRRLNRKNLIIFD